MELNSIGSESKFLQNSFQTGCTNFHYHQHENSRYSMSPPILGIVSCKILTLLLNVQKCLRTVLIFTSILTNEVENIFLGLLAIGYYLLSVHL